MKQVEFLGKQWEVPDWAKWITQDADDGEILVWDEKPIDWGGIYFQNGDAKYESVKCHHILPTIQELK